MNSGRRDIHKHTSAYTTAFLFGRRSSASFLSMSMASDRATKSNNSGFPKDCTYACTAIKSSTMHQHPLTPGSASKWSIENLYSLHKQNMGLLIVLYYILQWLWSVRRYLFQKQCHFHELYFCCPCHSSEVWLLHLAPDAPGTIVLPLL